jgi:hypothetical protein
MIKYNAKFKSKELCVCIIDDTADYKPWMRELVKNAADYTITNCTGFGYDVYVDTNEDRMLRIVSNNYKIAVVISAGTEFINGSAFFDNLPSDFFLLAHIIDGSDDYFGLHYQCYVLNLEKYCQLGKPSVGKTELLQTHTQEIPYRSAESVHDDYLPMVLKKHILSKTQLYKSRYRGWNLISTGLHAGYEIRAFDETLRNSKHYLYRDVDTSSWVYRRYNYCLTQHTFNENTGDLSFPRPYKKSITQFVHPAAGMDWFHKLTQQGYEDSTIVKFYDYNLNALSEMRERVKNMPFRFEFHHVDAINDVEKFVKIIDVTDASGTVVHMSNIFSYEGTASLLPLKYRIEKENFLITWMQQYIPNAVLDFDQRAAEGIVPWRVETGLAKDLVLADWNNINLPSWHIYD